MLPSYGLKREEIDEFIPVFAKLDAASDADFVDAYREFHREARQKKWYSKIQGSFRHPR